MPQIGSPSRIRPKHNAGFWDVSIGILEKDTLKWLWYHLGFDNLFLPQLMIECPMIEEQYYIVWKT